MHSLRVKTLKLKLKHSTFNKDLQENVRFAKNKAKIALGRKRAARKVASMDVLKKRAVKAARKKVALKLTKGIPPSELSMARKIDIEKKLEKKKGKIQKIAKKLLPAIRKKELAKKQKKGTNEGDK